MSLRQVNLYTPSQHNFGLVSETGIAGWTVPGLRYKRFNGKGYYNKYVPFELYANVFMGNVLGVAAETSMTMQVYSPWVAMQPSMRHIGSVMLGSPTKDTKIRIEFQGAPTSSPTSGQITTLSEASLQYATGLAGRLLCRFQSSNTSYFVRLKISITAPDGSSAAPADTFIWIYDPVICEDEFALRGGFTSDIYDNLPAFMRLDDENINSISSTEQLSFPLHRFVEALCRPLDELNELLVDFDYVRPTVGTEKKSTLTDPYTADESYLGWLASVTGSTLYSLNSGFSPWAALEAYDGPTDLNTEPGQWSDVQDISDWSSIQSFNPNFFNTIDGYRTQLGLGVVGINAGRPDVIGEYVRSFLEGSSTSTTPVIVENYDRSNNYRIKLYVDPDVDPDPDGALIVDAVSAALPVGTTSKKVSLIKDSGQGSLDFSKVLYPAVDSSTSSAKGASVFSRPFVADSDGYGFTLTLNCLPDEAVDSTTRPELGGGVVQAKFADGSCLAYGQYANNSYVSATSATSTACDLGASSSFDIIVVLSDITIPTASIDTAGAGANLPAAWFLREKRLIACGKGSSGQANAWSLYLASGYTTGSDTTCRLLFVDGHSPSTSYGKYAVSDPIDFSILEKIAVFRVQRTDASTVKFYAQSSLYDDWATNQIGTVTLAGGTSTSTSAGSTAYLQILGSLTSTWAWAAANPLSCHVHRVMLFKTPISFSNSGPSTYAVALVEGNQTSTCESFIYTPTVDVNFANIATYSKTFNTSTSLQITVSESTPDGSLIAMRSDKSTTPSPAFWYFGTSGNSASGNNVLTVSGLTGSTNHVVRTTVLNPLTGATSLSNNTLASSAGGVITLGVQTIYDSGTSALFNGISLTKIDILNSAGTIVLASFTPSLLNGTASALDSYGKTWAISRTFPTSTVSFAPAQAVTRDAIQLYKGGPSVAQHMQLENFKPFSVALSVRRQWTASTGTIYSILRLTNSSDTAGLKVFFDGPQIKVEFRDGSGAVEQLASSTSAHPNIANDAWVDIVIRRSMSANVLSMVVNGSFTNEQTTSTSASATMPELTNFILGQGTSTQYNPRLCLSNLTFFDRFLSDAEITLFVNSF